jgi:Haem-binding domain
MRRAVRPFLLILVLAFIAIQFVPVARTNPAFDPKLAIDHQVQVPAEVKAILDRSCKDCHSDETMWPLYARIAPVSWLLANDVRDAREKMNLSEWGAMDADAARDVLIEVCRQVKKGQMPLGLYRLIHREAVLRPSDVTALCTWSDTTRKALRAAQ